MNSIVILSKWVSGADYFKTFISSGKVKEWVVFFSHNLTHHLLNGISEKNARDSFFPASLLYGFRRRRKISEQDASSHANANLFGLFSNIYGRLGRTLYEPNKRLAHFLRWWCKTNMGMVVLHHFAGLISRESRQETLEIIRISFTAAW